MWLPPCIIDTSSTAFFLLLCALRLSTHQLVVMNNRRSTLVFILTLSMPSTFVLATHLGGALLKKLVQ